MRRRSRRVLGGKGPGLSEWMGMLVDRFMYPELECAIYGFASVSVIMSNRWHFLRSNLGCLPSLQTGEQRNKLCGIRWFSWSFILFFFS
jgi:hypothetical protein